MTITNRIPALKGHGRRRAVDKVVELRDENRSLLTRLMAVDDAFAILRHDLAEAHARQTELEGLADRLQVEAIELTEERDGLAEEVAALRRRFGGQLAAEANATRIDVPPMVRDTAAVEDQATAPIDVRPLWDALGIRPVTDPGRIH